jgi:enamine deaminase RidA (YjgF/YER057c/UK114 family)
MADGRFVLTGGIVGWDTSGKFPSDFTSQVKQALANIPQF